MHQEPIECLYKRQRFDVGFRRNAFLALYRMQGAMFEGIRCVLCALNYHQG